MFLVVTPQCNSMEMNYLSTLVADECWRSVVQKSWGRGFFIFLPTMYFGVLSQIFNIGSLFTLGCQPCNTINDAHSEGKLPEDCNEIN